MDPYVILICRSQEQKSSVASGKLSLFSSNFYMSTFHLDGTDTWHNFYQEKINSCSDMFTESDVMFMFFYYREDGLGNPLYFFINDLCRKRDTARVEREFCLYHFGWCFRTHTEDNGQWYWHCRRYCGRSNVSIPICTIFFDLSLRYVLPLLLIRQP